MSYNRYNAAHVALRVGADVNDGTSPLEGAERLASRRDRAASSTVRI